MTLNPPLMIPCTKCGSTDTDLTREGNHPFPSNAVFRCVTCGNRLLGAGAVNYVQGVLAKRKAAPKRKRKVKPKNGTLHPLAPKSRPVVQPPADLHKEPVDLKALPDEEVEAVYDSIVEAHREPPEEAAIEAVTPEPSAPKPASSECAWVDCTATRRERSIYCSRECSNKNARARFAARKGKR